MKLLGIAALPDEEKIKIVERMANLVERRLILRLAKDLSDEDMDQLEALTERNAEDEAAALLRGKFPNLDAIVQEEIEAVKHEAVVVAKEIDRE